MPEDKTQQVIFSGHVQGVGFRFTVRSIAKRHPVKGYVKNLPDGTVELVMQGDPSSLNALLNEVTDYFQNNLSGCERRELEAAERFIHFEIRF